MINGSDVSSWNPSMPAVQAFLLIKATQGTTYINPRQATQAAVARRAGAHVGFYHFIEPGNIVAQAQYFVEKCASIAGDSLWEDWEPTPQGLATVAEKDVFIRTVQQLRPTHRTGLYCDLERWLHVDTTSFAGDGLWIADPSHPKGKPAIKAPWLVQQWGTVGGVDADIAQFSNKGAMISWANHGASTTPLKLPKPPAPPAHPTYRVVTGDTLTSIAAHHGTTIGKLVALNHIKNPNLIYPGEILELR